MLKNISGAKINITVSAGIAGDNILVAGTPGSSIFVYELIGSPSVASTVKIKDGAADVGKALFVEGIQQGLTLTEVAGEDGEPRFWTTPGNDLILNVTAGTFTGNLYYALRQ